ncbi:MAG: hypothetical protein IPH57_15955 [Saprospiraceae bacterium]|nr:hypothetical protein [Saprospiraceae bacterium]
MSKNYKITGFAKFLIFMLFATPLSFIGASYYNGQDPFETIKTWEIFKKKETDNIKSESINIDEKSVVKELKLKELEIKQLNEKIIILEDLLEAQKKEIAELKAKK